MVVIKIELGYKTLSLRAGCRISKFSKPSKATYLQKSTPHKLGCIYKIYTHTYIYALSVDHYHRQFLSLS